MALKLAHLSVRPEFCFFVKEHIFAMVVPNAIKEGRKIVNI